MSEDLPAQVHARDKPIPRGGDAVYSEDALLQRTAEITIGYSGAELANLLNEAAILMVLLLFSDFPITGYLQCLLLGQP